VKGEKYRRALGPGGRLKYPHLPTINVGNKSRVNWVPAELVDILHGQVRSGKVDGDMTAMMIRYSAVRPEERFGFITNGSAGAAKGGAGADAGKDDDGAGEAAVVHVIRKDRTARGFGLHDIAPTPMAVSAVLLPPAKIQYGQSKILDPKLSGSWNHEGYKFISPPAGPSPPPPGAPAGERPAYTYGVLVVMRGGSFDGNAVDTFKRTIERDCASTGVQYRTDHNNKP